MSIMMSRLCKLVLGMCSWSVIAITMADMTEFRQIYRPKLLAHSVPARNGQCMLWTGATSRSKGANYGVIRCKFQGRSRRYYVHRLAFIFSGDWHIDDLEDGMDVGHLCHNPLCINSQHLSYEPHQVNRLRSACVKAGVCSGHFGQHPPCLLELKV